MTGWSTLAQTLTVVCLTVPLVPAPFVDVPPELPPLEQAAVNSAAAVATTAVLFTDNFMLGSFANSMNFQGAWVFLTLHVPDAPTGINRLVGL